MTSRIVQVLCLLFCLLSFSSAQAQTPAPGLSLTNCTSNNYSSPTASTMSCTLTNSGVGAISSISYSTLAGMTVSGPTSCSASASCGMVRMTTGTTAGAYNGSLTITPNTGAAVVLPVNLAVYASDAVLNLRNCTQVNPTVAPTAATMNCALRKMSSAAINSLTYTSPAGTTISGPASCTGTVLACGTVSITTATTPGNYTSNATITPNTGAAASLPINLTVTTTPAVLSFKACSDVTPTVTPQRASTTCTLGNTGGAVSSITYSSGLPVGSNITGPSSCAANSDCGTVTVTTRLTTGTYMGTMSATPNAGSAATRPINLSVVAALTGLNLKSCVDVNPSEAPNQASTSCTLNNASATAVTSISYAGLPATMDITGPTSCSASADCGTVLVRSGNAVGIYSGTLTITPNTGAVVNKTINLQVNQAAVALSLKSCDTSNATTIAPTAASRSCVLRNNGSSTISTISYTPPVGQTVVGPTSCGANADCGTITSTSETIAKAYNGNVTITPNSGSAITMPSNLRVNTDTMLNLTACTDVTSTNSPTPAKTTCTLTNTGGTNASTITYSGLTSTGLTASGPASCAANTTCGDVIITSSDVARTYNGTLTVAAATGTAATKVVQLVVNPALMILSLESCQEVNPTISPTRATRTCNLRNTGESSGTLTYSQSANPTYQLEGPPTCPSKGICGVVILRSGTEPGSYALFNQIQIIPSQGTPLAFGGVLKVNPREAELVLSNCSTVSPATIPTSLAITSCDMRNTGQVSPDDIIYSTLAGVTVTGARSCPAGADCGKVEVKANGPGVFTGQITITPIKMQVLGKVTVLPVNLEQRASAARLDFKMPCTEVSPTVTPNSASIRCQLKNYGQTAVSSITYAWPAWVQVVSAPNSCAGDFASCGWVEIKTPTAPGIYDATIRPIPNTGTAANINISLKVLSEGIAKPTIQITRNPNPLVAGQSFTTTWATTGATNLRYVCTANGAGYQEMATVASVNGSAAPMTASADWIANPSLCTWTATGEGGVTTLEETVTTVNPPLPTLSITRNPSPLVAGQTYTTTVSSTNATSVTYQCTSNGGYTSNTTAATLNGTITGTTAMAAWVDKPSQCTWIATGPGGSTQVAETLTTVAAPPAPTLTITRNPNNTPWIVGQSYTTTIESTNATTVAYNCVVDDNNAGGYKGLGTTVVNGTTAPVTAISSWVGHPSTCTWTATGPGGNKVVTEKLTTVSPPAGPPVIVNFNASNTNIRVATGQSGNVTFTGEASQSSGQITKLELFSNNGSGYGATPVESVSGTTSSLSINTTVPVSAGSYRFKLRATNQDGTTSESTEIIVNVTDSALLGEISGIRTNQTDSSKLELFGWACQYNNATALTYTVYADAPANLGGTVVMTGTANVATETTNAAVKEICGTPNASHHFVLNLDAYAQAYQGRRLFVEVATSNNAIKATLPCADYSCTMPGALRIGLTTPKNNDRYSASAVVFMNAKIVSGNSTDEVAFQINDEWIPATGDTILGLYFAQKANVPPRETPYPIIARVKHGNTMIYSAENLVYIGAVNDTVTVAMVSPTNNLEAPVGTPIKLQAEVIPKQQSEAQIATVKFTVDGNVLPPATGPVSNNWTYNWTPTQLGLMTIKAQAFNADGKMLGESSLVKVNGIEVQGPSSAEPLSVEVAVPYLDNPDAGTLAGSLNVSASGAATYSIPLDVPPGTAGLQPQLSLNYSSQSQNSRVGLGWNLGGFSSIHRCGMTIAQDGINGRISFDEDDRLCLDGQRLILVNKVLSGANYWSVGAEFRTESESFTKITAIGEIGARTFEVQTKDGRISIYGGDTATVNAILGKPNSGVAAAVPSPKNGAQSWAINTVKDRSNNYIRYVYGQHQITGEHRPAVILYGGNGLNAHAAVEFKYENRQDGWTRYIDETRNDLRNRLVNVKTYIAANVNDGVSTKELLDKEKETGKIVNVDYIVVGGSFVRETKLTYEYSPTSGRSLLQSVEACTQNPQSGTTECLPKTSFNWGKPDTSKNPGFVSRGMWSGAPILTTNTLQSRGLGSAVNHADFFVFSDFNSDGYSDILEKRVATEKRGTDPFEIGNPSPRGFMKNSYRYFHNNGTAFVEHQYRINTLENFVVLTSADFNGDGLTDILVSTPSGAKICLSPFNQTVNLNLPNTTLTFFCDPDRAAIGTNTAYGTPLVVDVAGDGRFGHYGNIQNEKALFCLDGACVLDPNPPKNVLTNLDNRADGPLFDPLNNYLSFEAMVDFSGVGKAEDVRWTRPKFWRCYTEGNDPYVCPRTWVNLTPTVHMQSFSLPGVSRRNMQNFIVPINNSTEPCLATGCAPYNFDAPISGANVSADFNGAGYASLVFGFYENQFITVDPQKPEEKIYQYKDPRIYLCLSTGRALDCNVRKKISGDNFPSIRAVGNFIGDGQSTVLIENITYSAALPPQPNGSIKLCHFVGDNIASDGSENDANIACESWGGVQLPTRTHSTSPLDQVYLMDLLGTGRTQLIYYHSGKMINCGYYGGQNYPTCEWKEDGRWEIFEPIDLAKPNEALDRIVSVTNGVGATSTVEYADSIPSGIVTQSASQNLSYPLRKTPQTGKIASRLRHSNGVAPERSSRYQYEDAAIDVSGRGSLGFAKFTVTDEQTGIVNVTTYKQGWPYTGMVDVATVSVNNKVLSKSSNTWNSKAIEHKFGENNVIYAYTKMVYADTKVETWDFKTGDHLGTTTTTNTYGDNWGNLTKQVTQLTGTGGPFTTTSNSVYDNAKTSWLIGQMTHTDVTKTKPDNTAITRNVDATYDAVTGLPETQTIEKDDDLLRLTTTFVRNSFGLVKTKTETWKKPNTDIKDTTPNFRSSLMTYDPNGRFIDTVTNVLTQTETDTEIHTETHTYEPGTGARKTLKGPNLLTTTWHSNGFGRITKELRADGNETRSYVKSCRGNDTCPVGDIVQITEHFNGLSRTSVPTLTFVDHASHVLRQQTYGFDGTPIFSDQSYDHLGRASTTYHPYFEKATRVPASRQEYDALSRVETVVTFAENGAELRATTDYQGLTTKLVNPLGQNRVELRNLAKQLIKVTDHYLGETAFEYEPNGNLSKTTDPNGNIITVKYDNLGRKTQLNDPDLGQIDYAVDPIGQVWKQVSPKQRPFSQATTFVFDALGRMTARYETDLESHWVFDTASKGIGQLAEAYTGTATNKTYQRVHTYTSQGRPSTTTQSLTDGTYVSKLDYDAWGRVIQQRYKRKTDTEKNFGSRYNDKGYLHWIERGGLKLRTIVKQDASQRVLETLSGNGLKEKHGYNPYTGRMGTVDITTAANAVHITETYSYDSIGNVKTRDHIWDIERVTEDFGYDQLNRLTSSNISLSTSPQASTEQIFTYDKVGNILTKTNVANNEVYKYPKQGEEARPHAVKSIGDTYSFTYDDNGNLINGAGRNISWTSFDMPDRIEKAGITSDFKYGPEHQRTVQVKNQGQSDKMTVIYAGAQEVEIKGSVTTIKTYWPLGIGVEIDRGTAGTEYNWTHADRLGSPIAHTDQNGIFREKMAYDAWGKRRNLADSVTPTDPGLAGKTDNRGFTGHEMLDALELVHMNGRVYDPLIGKFVSADPILQDPMNGQSYNRYAYVLNNPTNLTDPTGFCNQKVEVTGSSVKQCPEGAARTAEALGTKNTSLERVSITEEKTGKVVATGVFDSSGQGKINPKDTQSKDATIKGGGGAAERFVEQHRSDMEAGNGKIYEPLQPIAVAVTSVAVGGSGIAALATTATGRAILAMLGFGLELQSMSEGVPYGGGLRLPRDMNVNPIAPAALPTNRAIGLSATQNAEAQRIVADLKAQGYTDIRVNQQQTNALGSRVGVNRPDISGTSPGGRREHFELDKASSNRAAGHEARLKANDPSCKVTCLTVN
ncbi:hypothetical protein H8K52_18010 [Undibacterium seohonense]|uniref:Ig-like domain-containing protein n=1 Tax=Undibacterium seohonense TaxID=1344950 RepID=A0ABR6X8G9_9BURK|nr:RHS repeat-associated core domain-containing protein [Undibacterium seohonense]MBC3809238.1 hypothetical protein [Undibacterium seohonense]